MKKIASIVLSLLLVAALLVGCGTGNKQSASANQNASSSNSTSSSNKERKTIAVIVKSTMFEYWQAVKKGAEDAGKR